LLPCSEALSYRGRRLNDTTAQRQTPTYAPDVELKVDVAEASNKLLIKFSNDDPLVLVEGEVKPLRLWFTNAGPKAVREVWVVTSPEDHLWIGTSLSNEVTTTFDETFHSNNSLSPELPRKVLLGSNGFLLPGDSVELSVYLHAMDLGDQELCLLILYREV
jgi:trafficking protein particle complex subunit 8